MKAATLYFLVILFLVPSLGLAKSLSPEDYQEGKLLSIKETQEPVTVTKPVAQPDGSTLNLPQTEIKKVYHIAVQLGDKVYVGRYTPPFSFQKRPSWVIGDKVQVNLNKNKMRIKKANGKDLKTKIEQTFQASEYRAPTGI